MLGLNASDRRMPSFRQNNLLAWTIFACLVVVPLSHIKTELLVDNLQRQGGALGKDFSVSDGAACNRPWVESNPFPLPTAYGGTAASDGTYVYVAGGYSIDRNMTLDAFRRFDPVTDIWTLLAPLPDA